LRCPICNIEDGFTTSNGRSAEGCVSNDHAVTRLKSLNLVGSSLESSKIVSTRP
jgi:hypothetical protein